MRGVVALVLLVGLVLGAMSACARPQDAAERAAATTASVKRGDRVASGIGLSMVYVEPQTFAMGSPKDQVGFYDQAQHAVTISKGYWLGETEVTQKMWREVMETEPWKGKEHAIEGDTVAATLMDWDEAVEFCRRLTLREEEAGRLPLGYEYCLPTEAEWELACRAGSTARDEFGGNAERLDEFAVFRENRDGEHPHRVKSRKANGFGFFDMIGNVWEFCADEVTGSEVPGDTDGDSVRDPYSRGGEQRIIRGCGFYSVASSISLPIRRTMGHGDRYVDTGFRPALAARFANK
ncbi:MAG: formylglycine-generating enzyme family protein [Planctomycetes bacterium]|nr:formylglycine-generating enzyme family protein [Planctomycetota bacterium]